MIAKTVSIRLSYLLCPDLTASMKLVWLGLRLDRHLPQGDLFSPTRLQRRIGVSRPTIRKALRRLKYNIRPRIPADITQLSQTPIRVHARLSADTSVPAMARVLYCILLGLVRLKRFDILSSYAGIARVVRLQPRTVRKAIFALVNAGWLAISQVNQRAKIQFSFPDPNITRIRAELRRIEQRLEKSKYHGEALALLWCDTLVNCTNYKDDYFPKAFTNPLTNELLQADRYYFDHRVAIEFNGPQHDGPTMQFSSRQSKKQIIRDRMKNEISKRQNIALITLQPEDLTFHQMRCVLGKYLPLHSVNMDHPIIVHLEERSQKYIQAIHRIRREVNQVLSSNEKCQSNRATRTLRRVLVDVRNTYFASR